MPDTLEQMARQLLAYCPFVPQPLCEYWIRDRWRRACESRHWSFLRAQGQFLVGAAYSTGTVAVTRGVDTVVGTSTAWTSANSNSRQFKLGSTAPVYTATYVSATSLTLDRVYGGTTANGQSYKLLDAYVSAPTDFLSFRNCINPTNQWRMWVDRFTTEDLDIYDPSRISEGDPYIVAGFANTSAEVARFEIWPHPTSQNVYPFIYIKRVADITSSTSLPRIITGDILVRGALADLCRWPGVEARPNPMFNLPLSASYELEFRERVAQQGKQDNEIFQTDLSYDSFPLAPYPMSASFAQSHAMYESGLPAGSLYG